MEDIVTQIKTMIDHLPADAIKSIVEEFEWRKEMSSKVAKMVQLFSKLEDEEKKEFFNNIKPLLIDGNSTGLVCVSETTNVDDAESCE